MRSPNVAKELRHKRGESHPSQPLESSESLPASPKPASKSGPMAFLHDLPDNSSGSVPDVSSLVSSLVSATSSDSMSRVPDDSQPAQSAPAREDIQTQLAQAMLEQPPVSIRVKSYSNLTNSERHQVQWTAFSMLTQLFNRTNTQLKVTPADVSKLTEFSSPIASQRTRSSAGQWLKAKLTLTGKPLQETEKTGVFDVPLQKSMVYASIPLDSFSPTLRIPIVLHECATFLGRNGRLDVAGLFRVSGSERRIQSKIPEFDQAPKYGLGASMEGVTPHDVTAILKRWLRSLPDPIFTRELLPCFLQVADLPGDWKQRLKALRLLVAMLPPDHLATVEYLFRLLKQTADHSDQNQMTAHNLARVMAPNLLCTPSQNVDDRNSGFSSLHEYERAAEVTEIMIESYGRVGAPLGRWTGLDNQSPCAVSVLEDDPTEESAVFPVQRPLSFAPDELVLPDAPSIPPPHPPRPPSFIAGDDVPEPKVYSFSTPIVAIQHATLPRDDKTATGHTTAYSSSSLETSPATLARQTRTRKDALTEPSSDELVLVERRVSSPGPRLRRRDASRTSNEETDKSGQHDTIAQRIRSRPRKVQLARVDDGHKSNGEDLSSRRKRKIKRSLTEPTQGSKVGRKRGRRQKTVASLEECFAALSVQREVQ